MSRRGRTPRDFLDYDSVSEAELERLAHDGLVDVSPPFDGSVLFDPQFERRADELNRRPFVGVQSVSVLEQKQGPWSGNPQLGIEQPFAPASNNEQTILKLDEWGMPRVWSVMLGIDYDEDSDPNAGFGLSAHIVAGAGGITQEFDVDWINGTTFSICMNALNVIARFTSANVVPDNLRLRASIGIGRLSSAPPTVTQSIPGLVPGGGSASSQFFRIPQFAKSLTIVDQNIAADSVYSSNVTVDFKSGLGTLGLNGQVTGANIREYGAGGYPISGAQHYVRVTANNPIVSVNPTLVFFLGL